MSAPPGISAKKPALVVLVLIIVACLGVALRDSPRAEQKKPDTDRYFTVKKGDFPITVLATGNLDAFKRHSLQYVGRIDNIRDGLKVKEVVKDRSYVKQGDTVVQFMRDEAEKEETRMKDALQDDAEKHKQAVEDLEAKYIEKKTDIERLVRLDTELMLEAVEKRETEYFDKRAELVQSLADAREDDSKAQQDGEMLQAADMNKVKSSAEALRVARDAFDKYENLEARKTKNDLLTNIEKAETQYNASMLELTKVQDALASAQNLSYSEREPLEKAILEAEKKIVGMEMAWDLARDSLRNHMQYGHPEKMRSLQAAVEQARLTLKQEVVRVRNAQTQTSRSIRTSRYKVLNLEKEIVNLDKNRDLKMRRALQEYEKTMHDHEVSFKQRKDEFDLAGKRGADEYMKKKERLEKELKALQDSMEKMTLTAPSDGIVSLGQPQDRYGRQQDREIEVGTAINPGEVVATIPDLSKFIVKSDIPEAYRSQLKIGLEANLRSPAVPNLRMSGQLTKIAPMTTHMVRWDQNSPKVYATEFATDSSDPQLMPGMTVEVEILVETVKDVFFVPIESLYNREDKVYCQVLKGSQPVEREIKPGRRSIHFVEILSGLKAGEKVAVQDAEIQGK